MAIWAISDLHLSLGNPKKSMEHFGGNWIGYIDKITSNWKKLIQSEDLVLIPGDISWAMKAEDALIDLLWIHNLPGTKLLLKGNHDFWWSSPSKLRALLPSSIHFIQNNAFNWQNVTIGGSRLWDTPEYNFEDWIIYQNNPLAKEVTDNPKEDEKIFLRELERLEMSLKQMNPQAEHRIAMTHYPPIGPLGLPSKCTTLLEKYHIELCIFGHLHNLRPETVTFKNYRGVQYMLTSTDFLNHTPIRLF